MSLPDEMQQRSSALPASTEMSMAIWLLDGLDGFYAEFAQKGYGNAASFPGYVFYIGEDIATQFKKFYERFNSDTQATIKQGIALALEIWAERSKWSPATAYELVRIGMEIDPDRTSTATPRILASLRQKIDAETDEIKKDDLIETYCGVFSNITPKQAASTVLDTELAGVSGSAALSFLLTGFSAIRQKMILQVGCQ